MAYRNRNEPLENARKGLELTQTQLAERSGVRQSTISMFEAGHLPNAIASVLRLAKALGQPVESLFGHMVPAPTSPTSRTKKAATKRRKPAARKRAKGPGPKKARADEAPPQSQGDSAETEAA